MRRFLMTLCLTLTVLTCSFSQDTLKITSEQLRITNLIFNEHDKYGKQIPILKEEIKNLKLVNSSWERTDSITKLRLNKCYTTINTQNQQIEKLEKSVKVKNYVCISSIVLAILCLMIN